MATNSLHEEQTTSEDMPYIDIDEWVENNCKFESWEICEDEY